MFCIKFGSVQQDSQKQTHSKHASVGVLCQLVLLSTVALLIAFKGEKVRMKLTKTIKQINQEGKKTKCHYFCHYSDTQYVHACLFISGVRCGNSGCI